MKIFVKAKPKSKKDELEKVSENTFVARVREAPEKGRGLPRNTTSRRRVSSQAPIKKLFKETDLLFVLPLIM